MDLPVNVALRFWENAAFELIKTYTNSLLIPPGWRFEWLDEKSLRSPKTDQNNVYGMCYYKEKKIALSKYVAINGRFLIVSEVVRHEIAHAVVGPGHGHDKAWRQACKIIGCIPREIIPKI
jgi:hypothetical protein